MNTCRSYNGLFRHAGTCHPSIYMEKGDEAIIKKGSNPIKSNLGVGNSNYGRSKIGFEMQ